ncbi:hypothetical protein EJB05_07106, partial [Eragrostis curvula]
MAAATALPLPDDLLAAILARLPSHTLAASRCVCKAWRAVVDAHDLLLPHVLPHDVRGIFINFVGRSSPLFFSRSSPASSRICGDVGRGSVIDHCNGLLLCGHERSCEYSVVNPATRRRDRVPSPRRNRRQVDHVAYLVFDPAVSPHYEVFLFPDVPEKPRAMNRRDVPPTPVNLSPLFSSFDDTPISEDTEEEEEEEECVEEPAIAPPPPSIEEGFFPAKTLSLSLMWKLRELQDTYGSMEWPPSPCTLHVFSSSTRRWEERAFVREGDAMGTVERMRLDTGTSTYWGPRWRYGVYWRAALHIHCRGGFLMRLSLTDRKYQVIKTPEDIGEGYEQSNLGRSAGGVYLATVHSCQLHVWILNESRGQIEWVLKHHVNLDPYSPWPTVYRERNNGRWILHDAKNDDDKNMVISDDNSEWDSDGDDILDEDDDTLHYIDYFLGFHPYKEIIFFVTAFTGVAYNLSNSKVRYLGELRPNDDYDTKHPDAYCQRALHYLI